MYSGMSSSWVAEVSNGWAELITVGFAGGEPEHSL